MYLSFYTLCGILFNKKVYLHPKRYKIRLKEFVKEKRGHAKLTQPELAEKAGVGLRFLRELEQGKQTLRLDKVNQVLGLFGYEVGAVKTSQITTS